MSSKQGEDCRSMAEQCLALAAAAQSVELKRAWLGLADICQRLIKEADRPIRRSVSSKAKVFH
jgi:hypothetical protein